MDTNKIKIPTLLGLGVLLAGLFSATILVGQDQLFQTRATTSATPKSILLTNLTSNSASIIWQTDIETTGFATIGTTQSASDKTYNDERDSNAPQKHSLHSVTLTNLLPQTTYYFKVNSGGTFFESKEHTFTTPESSDTTNLPPVIASVVDSNLQPVSEALVVLNLVDGKALSTITKLSGSFILPLSGITEEQQTTLVIYNNQLKSEVVLTLPTQKPLSTPIILGQNQNLVPQPTPTPNLLLKYDLNSDGILNSLDLAIILKNVGQRNFQIEADVNSDNTVDQKDVDEFKSFSAGPQ